MGSEHELRRQDGIHEYMYVPRETGLLRLHLCLIKTNIAAQIMRPSTESRQVSTISVTRERCRCLEYPSAAVDVVTTPCVVGVVIFHALWLGVLLLTAVETGGVVVLGMDATWEPPADQLEQELVEEPFDGLVVVRSLRTDVCVCVKAPEGEDEGPPEVEDEECIESGEGGSGEGEIVV